jgi:ADP-L-glycero-D-manno-heptose 6-epimerase|tara:strand:+ start:15347 stop:16162 length:816 start_codon:yes stop_codon:yes gene_type:complete
MKICVTGAEGFIGKNLCKHLDSMNHEVTKFEYAMNSFPDPSMYDWVIHLGAISSTTERNVELIMDQNYEYSLKLLQMCDTMGVNFQYSSSASVYGNTNSFVENGPIYPQSPYAWSKYLFDRFVQQAMGEFKILVQGFRYFNVYGDHEEHKGDQASPVTKFSKQAKENGIIKLFENSDQYLRDFVCVDDVCNVHCQMLQHDVSGIYNVGTGTATSFQSVADSVAKKYNAKIQTIPMPQQLTGQYQSYTCADLTELNKNVTINYKTVEQYLND